MRLFGHFQNGCNIRLTVSDQIIGVWLQFLRFKVDEIPPVLEEAAGEGMDTSISPEATPEVLKS